MTPDGPWNPCARLRARFPDVITGRVGIDLVPFDRVRRLVAPGTDSVLPRMLSEEEIRISRTPTGADIPGIAGRLAAKEAVFKLFRVAGEPLPWLGITIVKEPGGWPAVHLSGRAERLALDAGIEHIDVSISHDGPYAIAVAFSTPGAESSVQRLKSA